MIELIQIHSDAVERLCRQYGVERLGIFGSAVLGTFDEGSSDLDFLVEFRGLTVEDGADRYLGLLVDLEDLFGRKIDLISYRAIRNPYFKEVVDRTRVTLYAA